MKRLTTYQKVLSSIAVVLACFILSAPFLNAQFRHMWQANAHLKKIAPQWKDFKSRNQGFELIKIWVTTAGDGAFIVSGYVVDQEHVDTLMKFIESTSPPRPIRNAVRIAPPEMIADMVKQQHPQESEQAVASDGHKPSSRAQSDDPIAPADAH